MLTQPARDLRAWRAATIDDPRSWYYPLSASCLAALDRAVQDWRCEVRHVTEIRLPESLQAACSADLDPVRTALDSGRGFAIVQGLPVERYPVAEAQAMYWLIGQALGRPVDQNTQGARLYDVRDTGQDVVNGARFSVTNAESTFHTDNSFGDPLFDYVGLLCVRTAKRGGMNQVVSGYTVYQELRDQAPDALETLSQPFHVDRRAGIQKGQAPTAWFPIFAEDDRGLAIRYLRYWIEAGHQKAGDPLTPAQRRALHVLDDMLRRQDLRVEFTLRPGEVFFSNNRWIFHNRTAFEDYSDVEQRRHYVRLWLAAKLAQA
jgi:alpha-ketoglutarate-dependent taurine dioxygenase